MRIPCRPLLGGNETSEQELECGLIEMAVPVSCLHSSLSFCLFACRPEGGDRGSSKRHVLLAWGRACLPPETHSAFLFPSLLLTLHSLCSRFSTVSHPITSFSSSSHHSIAINTHGIYSQISPKQVRRCCLPIST